MTAEDGSQILPPDWTVAYTVYADLMEGKHLICLTTTTKIPKIENAVPTAWCARRV